MGNHLSQTVVAFGQDLKCVMACLPHDLEYFLNKVEWDFLME